MKKHKLNTFYERKQQKQDSQDTARSCYKGYPINPQKQIFCYNDFSVYTVSSYWDMK